VARRSGFPSRHPRSSGVARDWGAGVGSSSVTVISSSGATVLGAGVQTLGSELTLLRTRGICDIGLSGAPNTDGAGYFGAVGIGVFTDQAFTAGVASLPTPLDDVFSNVWLWHTFFSVHVGDVSFAPGPGSQFREMIDSKAMRKFDSNMVMAAVIDVVEIGTAILNVWLDSRILFQDSGR